MSETIIPQPKPLKIKWLKGEEVVKTVDSPMQMPQLLECISGSEKEAIALGATHITVVFVVPEGAIKDKPAGTEMPFLPDAEWTTATKRTTLTPDECYAWFKDKIMPLGHFLQFIDTMISQAMTFGPLKGVIVTALIDKGPQPAIGLGMLNPAYALTAEDIKVLAETASSQVEEFKDKMREAHDIAFPGDKSANLILMPGQIPHRPIITGR